MPSLALFPSFAASQALFESTKKRFPSCSAAPQAFLTNKKGYPCLSKKHQALIHTLFNHSVQVMICGQPLHGPSDAAAMEASAGSDDSGNEGSDGGE
ncbi:unnamed protein product [Closterium sp. NIES-54]